MGCGGMRDDEKVRRCAWGCGVRRGVELHGGAWSVEWVRRRDRARDSAWECAARWLMIGHGAGMAAATGCMVRRAGLQERGCAW